MNPIKVKIKEYLDSLPSELLPLKEVGIRYLKHSCSIDTDSVHIAHRPWLGSLNYAITLFPPAKKIWIKRYNQNKMPISYQRILLGTNGLFAFGLSLYGLAPSMQHYPTALDRTRQQCFDLSLANKDWIREYELDQHILHFGGREFSYMENIGYFMSDESKIQAYRKTGELLQEWRDFSEFLENELYTAEQIAKEQTEESWWPSGV
jgi:hypothetical protein